MSNEDLINNIDEFREKLDSLSALIVCEVNEHETTRGFSINPELLKLLVDMNASLEIDVNEKIPPQ